MKFLIALVSFFLISSASDAQLQAYLNLKRFYAPGVGTFVEAYILVENTTVTYKREEDGRLTCSVEILQLFRQGDEIKSFQKYCLNGHVVGDTTVTPLLDQQRFVLSPGDYTYELEIKDLNEENARIFKYSEPFNMPANEQSFVSDIQLLQGMSKSAQPGPLTKSGYDLFPLVVNFYPTEFEKLMAYTEVYNTLAQFGNGGKYVLRQFIEQYESGNIQGDYMKISRETAAEVLPVITVFDITKLVSGNYNLVVEIRDRENQVVSQQKTYFRRENVVGFDPSLLAAIDLKEALLLKSFPQDSLDYFIRAINPLADDAESNWILRTAPDADVETKQRFFYAFWKSKNYLEPEKEWQRYREQIYLTNRLFGSGVRQGFESDRGRIYLKYGAPATVMDRPNEPSSYPYQIWHYYKIGNFTNKRFVFYNPNLATNEYELLHSELRGEVQNYRWQTMLNYRNTPADGSIDDPIQGNYKHWGGNSSEFFVIPR